MLRSVLGALCLVCLAPRAVPGQDAPSTRPCSSRDTTYYSHTALADREEWYGKHLRAMREAPLCSKLNVETYRFLWLRSFHAPMSVRLDRVRGSYRLSAKALSGAGGYDPGKLIRDTVLSLSATQWSQVQALITGAGYWQMAPDSAWGEDGAQWVLEAVKDGQYHVVDRWTPGYKGRASVYRDLCLYVVTLAGFMPDSTWIY